MKKQPVEWRDRWQGSSDLGAFGLIVVGLPKLVQYGIGVEFLLSALLGIAVGAVIGLLFPSITARVRTKRTPAPPPPHPPLPPPPVGTQGRPSGTPSTTEPNVRDVPEEPS